MPSVQHALLETEANQIRASILDMAHCIRTFTDEVSEYSRKLVGIVQQIEGGEQIVEDGVGMAHTEHVRLLSSTRIMALFPANFLFLKLFFFFTPGGPWNGGERALLRPCILRRPPRDAVSAGGDGPERGGRSRQGEAHLAEAAAGGHDHPAVSGLHRLPALRENPPAGQTPSFIKQTRANNQTDSKAPWSYRVVFRRRTTAEWCWRSRRSTVCWRLFRSSSTSSRSWPITSSWTPASPSPSLRYPLYPPTDTKKTNTRQLTDVFSSQDNRVHIGPKMEIRVVTLGLDGAGKTTILFKLKQDEFMQPIPTIGTASF